MPPTFDRAVATRDLEVCQDLLRRGSKSFHAASLLLPRRMRAPAAAVYAFCRVADDAVDLSDEPGPALDALRGRLRRAFDGRPDPDPVDRALAAVGRIYGLPIEAFEGLLEGFAWDVEGRRYETLAELRGYCVRVASTVGVMMTVLMGVRRERTLWRACDLGVAMQLTNIARDVGEDAREGRVYLPAVWLAEVGLRPEDLIERPVFSPELGFVVRRLLDAAERLYARADAGVDKLPRDCRTAIRAARLIYADIDRAIVDAGYDTMSQRAYTTGPRKAWLALRSLPAALSPVREMCLAPPVPEAAFLIDAVVDAGLQRGPGPTPTAVRDGRGSGQRVERPYADRSRAAE
jgi:phytoene synthase